MARIVLIYGFALAVLFGLLKYLEYSYFVRDIPLELYIGGVAVGFAALGLWAGFKLNKQKGSADLGVLDEFQPDPSALSKLGVSKREQEVLELIAEGLSNREIAERLFVSTSTVKTHTSNLFSKLDARRRTQAVQIAKELRLIR
jgi:DNA-binding CsgD family transcriptional regulator